MLASPSVLSDTTSVTVRENGTEKRFPLHPLPTEFIQWQIHQRLSIFDHLLKGEKPAFLPSHLPSLITFQKNQEDFPVNVACKGVGLVPRDRDLETLTTQLKQRLHQIGNHSFQSSLAARMDAVLLLYSDLEKVHPSCLGGLEIFETNSFKNITQNPQVVETKELFYQFVASMRALFEDAEFHFQQPKYPFAVRYFVTHVIDKSLRVRGA
jgi:hypothetical protein